MAVVNLAAFICSAMVLVGRFTFALGNLNFSRGSNELIVQVGQRIVVDMNITGVNADIFVEARSSNPGVFLVDGNATFKILTAVQDMTLDNNTVVQEPDLEKNHRLSIVLKGLFIGISRLTFKVTTTNFIQDPDLTIDPIVVKVRRAPSIIATIFQYVLLVWLLISYVSMGVKMNWPEIFKRLRRPWGVIVGALCQFIIMPVLAFTLAKIANLDNVSAIGLIIFGCCPGGWLSNIFTLMLDCDLVLSITMTTCSTVIALALMPLNLFLYGRHYASQDESLRPPFGDLVAQLLLLVIPVLIGMVIYYKLPKVAKILTICLRPVVIIMIILALCFGIPSSLYIFQSPPEVYLVSIVFPFIGATLGLVFAKIACLENRSAITVAFETGSQNAVVALALARLSYPHPEADLIARIPNLIAIFTMIEGSVIVGIYVIMNRFPGKPQTDPNDTEELLQNDHEHSKKSSRKVVMKHKNLQTDLEDIKEGNETSTVRSSSTGETGMTMMNGRSLGHGTTLRAHASNSGDLSAYAKQTYV